MRIFITFNDPVPCERICRLNTHAFKSTTELLLQIAALCRVKRTWLIVTLKHEKINLRICEDWKLEMYPFKNGSQITVDILPEGLPELSPMNKSAKLVQIEEELELELEENSNFHISEFSIEKESSFDENKYFESCLEDFLTAVRKGSLEESALLLKKEPECQDENQLHQIMERKNRFLINEMGSCGRTALHWAVQQNNLELVEFLLIKNCNPNFVSEDQYTPLQLSIILKSASIFQTLVSHPKINLNVCTERGTALHVAIKEKERVFARKLIECGADSQIKNAKGRSAKQLAKEMNIEKLQFDFQSPAKYEIPQILRGKLYKVSSITQRLKERFLLVNPFTDEFIVYEKKEIEDRIKISQIVKLQVLRKKSWRMKKEFQYFEIGDKIGNQFTLAVKNKNICEEWCEQIKICLRFVSSRDRKIAIEEQLIEVIDDEKNEIKIHKRKDRNKLIDNVKNNNGNSKGAEGKSEKLISLFQIKPAQDNNGEEEEDEEEIRQSVLLADKIMKKGKDKQKVEEYKQSQQQSNSRTQSSNEKKEEALSIMASDEVEEDETDFRDSQILGSIIDNRIVSNSKLSPQIAGRKTYNFENKVDSFLSSHIEEKKVAPICFADFQILRLIGNGSFGKIYLTRHRLNQRLFAMKVLNKKKLIARKQLKYAIGQSNILKRLSHPFIITLHYSFQTPSNLFLILDYCPHHDLAEMLYDEDRITEKGCRFYIAQLILAIEYLHKNKILYRDLKPQNILIGEDGYIRLADFNLSKQNDFSMSFCGSPAYLSPEMLQKKGVGFQADIYGIGCVLYEMMVGEPPYYDDDMNVLYDNIRSGRLKFPSCISRPAKELVTRLLERKVQKRIGVKHMEEIKEHQFFKDFDWAKLEKGEMPIPPQFKHKFADEVEISLQVIKDDGFTDIDYSTPQNMTNRVKNFTFIRTK